MREDQALQTRLRTSPFALPGFTASRYLLAATAGLALCALGTPARSQPVTIPSSTVSSPSIGGSQQEQIAALVESVTPLLFEGGPVELRRAREELLRPLSEPNVSVAFRQAYTRELGDEIDRLLASEEPGERFVAIVLLGELATQDAVNELIGLFEAQEEAVVLFAITRAERVFEILQQTSTGLSPEQAVRLVNAVAEGIPQDQTVLLADARARALAKAVGVRDLRAAALSALSSRYGERVRQIEVGGLEEQQLRALVRSLSNARQALIDANANPLPPEALRELLAFSGDVLALMEGTLRRGPIEDQEVQRLAVAATQEAENIYVLARTALNPSGGQVPSPEFTRALERGDQRNFSLNFAQLYGQAGELTRAPFSLDGERFTRRAGQGARGS